MRTRSMAKEIDLVDGEVVSNPPRSKKVKTEHKDCSSSNIGTVPPCESINLPPSCESLDAMASVLSSCLQSGHRKLDELNGMIRDVEVESAKVEDIVKSAVVEIMFDKYLEKKNKKKQQQVGRSHD